MSENQYNPKVIAIGAFASVGALILMIIIQPDGYMQGGNAPAHAVKQTQQQPAQQSITTSVPVQIQDTTSVIDVGGISSEVRIVKDSVLSFKETISFESKTTNPTTKLLRNIGTKSKTIKGDEVKLELDQVTIDIDNNAEFGEQVTDQDFVTMKTGEQSRVLSTGIHTAVLNYKILNGITASSSFQELHFNLFYKLNYEIPNIEIIFYAPEKIPLHSVRPHFFVTNTSNSESLIPKTQYEVKEEVPSSRIRYLLRRVFEPGESLRVSLAWPRPNIFDFDNIPAKQQPTPTTKTAPESTP